MPNEPVDERWMLEIEKEVEVAPGGVSGPHREEIVVEADSRNR